MNDGPRIVRGLLLIAFLIVAACTPDRDPEQVRWRVALTSSGGIGGQGAGSVIAASDGSLEVKRFARVCQTQLSGANVRALQKAVGSIAPGRWKTGYLPHDQDVCCDRFYWKLDVELETDGGAVRHARADWHESAANQLPADLGSLARLAAELLERTVEGCEAA